MNRDHAILLTIIDYIDRLDSYIENCDIGTFCDDSKTYDASCMMLQQIGESASKLSEGICLGRLPIEYMRGLRNRITHDYIGLDDEQIRDTIKISIPEFKKTVESLLKSF